MFDLTGQVALVTGASSGLGAHFARVLAGAGAAVAVAARRTDRLRNLVTEIEGAGGKAVVVAMDVTDGESVIAALDATEKALGPISILVNNAGVASPSRFEKIAEEDWDFVMNTNLKGVWRLPCRLMAGIW